MSKITQEQYLQIKEARSIQERARLLEEYAGIETRPYTGCQYFCGGNFVGDDSEYTLDEVLKNAFVEVEE